MVKLLYPVEDARKLLSLGRSKLYTEIKAGRLTIVKAGGKTLVPQSELDRYVADRLAEAKQAGAAA